MAPTPGFGAMGLQTAGPSWRRTGDKAVGDWHCEGMDAAFQIIVMVLLLLGLLSVVIYAVRNSSRSTPGSHRPTEEARGEARAWGRHSGFD